MLLLVGVLYMSLRSHQFIVLSPLFPYLLIGCFVNYCKIMKSPTIIVELFIPFFDSVSFCFIDILSLCA